MTLLIFAGLLYLLGISIVLILKPSIMFSKDGNWKEFGLGRNKDKYTWMPFWLFSIIWAIVSYTIILVGASSFGFIKNMNETIDTNETNEMNEMNETNKSKPKKSKKPGYYMLDTNETMKAGVPKFIYLGQESPSVLD